LASERVKTTADAIELVLREAYEQSADVVIIQLTQSFDDFETRRCHRDELLATVIRVFPALQVAMIHKAIDESTHRRWPNVKLRREA
jgi:hypothetical protein